MESLLSKFKSLIGTYSDGGGYYDDEEEFDEEAYEEYEEERPALKIVPKNAEVQESQSILVQKPSREECMHVNYRPHRIEDMEYVVNALEAGKAVILHIDGIDPALGQRVLDFAAGVVCTMKCISDMPNDSICVLIPYDMDADELEAI